MSDQTVEPGRTSVAGVSRRNMLRGIGAGAAVVGGGGLLEACSSGIKGSGSVAVYGPPLQHDLTRRSMRYE